MLSGALSAISAPGFNLGDLLLGYGGLSVGSVILCTIFLVMRWLLLDATVTIAGTVEFVELVIYL